MPSPYQKAYFLLSAANVKQLPRDEGIEVAIVGRSNVGKSSVLNRLTNQKNLARVSKTPGRTQLLNVFMLDESHRLIDLPGYGYAKVPIAMKKGWQALIETYLKTRKSLKGVILVVDIRHPFKELDMKFLDYCHPIGIPLHILLNKADQLSRSEIAKTKQKIKVILTSYSDSVSVECFSALKGVGVRELEAKLNQWFCYS